MIERVTRASTNIASYLEAAATRNPDGLAIAIASRSKKADADGYLRITFSQLNTHCDRAAHRLRRLGIGHQTRVAMMTPPSLEFFSVMGALLKLGAVAVLIDPGMGLRNLGVCLAESEPEAFIGVPKAHAARICFGWARSSLRTLITVGRPWGWGGHRLDAVVDDAPDSAFDISPSASVAAIIFTSGSTGIPKGVEYTHKQLMTQLRMLCQLYDFRPGEADLSTFPLFALFAPVLGTTSVVPEMDASRPARADPQKLVRAIEQFGCTSTFLSPVLLDKLGRYCAQHSIQLPTLRRVISAGAPASPLALERFASVVRSGVEVFTPFGATEALPVASIGSDAILSETRKETERGAGVCVGKCVPGVEVSIIRITDAPIPEWSDDLQLSDGEIGEIVVKGANVTESYFNRRPATQLAKIYDSDGSVRHRMGDVGYFDEKGRLWMCGRKSQRVETEYGTMHTEPCEAIFNTHPSVFRSALVGLPAARNKQRPVLCVELEKNQRRYSARDRRRITADLLELARQHRHTRLIDTILYHPSFPVDVRHNSKIRREELAIWAARRLA